MVAKSIKYGNFSTIESLQIPFVYQILPSCRAWWDYPFLIFITKCIPSSIILYSWHFNVTFVVFLQVEITTTKNFKGLFTQIQTRKTEIYFEHYTVDYFALFRLIFRHFFEPILDLFWTSCDSFVLFRDLSYFFQSLLNHFLSFLLFSLSQK